MRQLKNQVPEGGWLWLVTGYCSFFTIAKYRLKIKIAGQSMEKEESDQVWDAVRKDRARGGYPWTHLSHPQDEEVWLNPEKLPDNIGRQAKH